MAEDGFEWKVTPGQAFADLFKAYTNTLLVSGARIGSTRAEQIQVWMQANAPWQDITGIARNSLYAVAEQGPQVVAQITIGYGYQAPHGLWLELAYAGKWGIIPKTIDYWGPIVWKDIQGMMNLGLITVGD
jgi:hypothetical protein